MSNIEFEEVRYEAPSPRETRQPFVVRILLKSGVVKDEKQAAFMAIGAAALALLVSAYALHSALTPPSSGHLPPETMRRMVNEMEYPPLRNEAI